MVYEKYSIKVSHYLYDMEKTGYNEYNITPLEDPVVVELTLADHYMRHWTAEEVGAYIVEKLKGVVKNGEELQTT